MSMLSRRLFLALGATALVSHRSLGEKGDAASLPRDLDHMLLGVNDLDRGIAWLEERGGVRAAVGGVHPGRGTHNALLSLGPKQYLEIIAPDPTQVESKIAVPSAAALVAMLRTLKEPKLVGWGAHTDDITSVAKKATVAGLKFDGPLDGSRVRPDGKTLRWKTLALENDFDGILPFFIEWSRESVHPSQDAPAGCRVQSLTAEAPQAQQVTITVRALGVDLSVTAGKATQLLARIAGTKGEFELR
jgi:Glyoxalase-like domain